MPTLHLQGFEYGDDGGEQPMVDAQESHEAEEEYEDPQREFATPAGSQSGESPDMLGGSAEPEPPPATCQQIALCRHETRGSSNCFPSHCIREGASAT